MSDYEDRVRREQEFFDHAPEEGRERTEKYYSITDSSASRYTLALDRMTPGKKVLELGCGEGVPALRLAAGGANVVGIDISPNRVEVARRAAHDRGERHAEFVVADAEDLPFGEGQFDVVCGQAILHHLDLERSLAEVARVLKPDGVAVFIEPLGHNPLINLYRARTPTMRTVDEHPLTARDLDALEHSFGRVDYSYFHLTSLAAVPFQRTPVFGPLVRTLEHLDRLLIRTVPRLARYSWRVVLELREPARDLGRLREHGVQ